MIALYSFRMQHLRVYMEDFSSGTQDNWPSKVVIFTDGASRGNPGDASLGLVVYDENEAEIFCYGRYLDQQTNNFAEYSAVKEALALSVQNNVDSLILKSDSQLLVKQLLGEYKVKSVGLKPIYLECKELIQKIGAFQVEHVRREYNKRADEIANIVLDGC